MVGSDTAETIGSIGRQILENMYKHQVPENERRDVYERVFHSVTRRLGEIETAGGRSEIDAATIANVFIHEYTSYLNERSRKGQPQVIAGAGAAGS